VIRFELKRPMITHDHLGAIPLFLDADTPESAVGQLDRGYRHGGGFAPFRGFAMTERGLQYPGDPPMALLAEGKLRDEIIRIYNGSWVAVVQPDGSFVVARMD
jgi:hypothetical protein